MKGQTMTDPAADLLAEALATVTGPRRAAYGTPSDNFEATAALWNAYLNERRKRSESIDRAVRSAADGEAYPIDQRPLFKRGRIKLDALDVAVFMDLLKTARLIVSPGHRDSWLDKAGYAACGWSCADAEGFATRPTIGGVDPTADGLRECMAEANEEPYADGPEYSDGHDCEGFPGGCARFGCPGGDQCFILPRMPTPRGTQHGELMRMQDEAERGEVQP
jgi:hypothetical protein